MLIMRPMRSRGNEVMCVCVVPSVTMSLAVVYAKRTSWCLLGLLPSQLSTTLREHGEKSMYFVAWLDSTRLYSANENAKCIFEPARGFQNCLCPCRIDQTWQFAHNPSSPYVSVFLLLSLYFIFRRGGRVLIMFAFFCQEWIRRDDARHPPWLYTGAKYAVRPFY
jgi:hypothetical protein